ncbi:MAG TPA: acyl-CoA dehydrogenase [Saprospiraceae bacterium]|nr:acyl-CoA dehydrogenase [Lewinellaceae bacterium]HPQ20491.1 acyl-CoA dehydrogenase [Saprospiraceae bacterium]
MSQYCSLDQLRFLLYEVFNVGELFKYERYQDHDVENFDILLDSIKDWSDKQLYPFFREMDEKPAYFEDGKVFTHPQIKTIFKEAGENGWLGQQLDYDHGGVQLPIIVNNAFNHIMEAANNHVPGYLGLTVGSAHLITTFGTKELQEKYVPNMLAGKWAGTMCLTEPQAGSSLSDVKTSAAPQKDGTYLIKGHKIFISGGDQQATDNFVHLVLARIDGAPAGTKGISLFVVPKYIESQDGDMQYNDVETAGDFQKLGQRGYSTVHLVFGDNNQCKGWLVGEANLGLKQMFQMMNGARIDVGLTAASVATAAYYASLQYAKERPQGRKLNSEGEKDASSEQVLIINHPDVKRMLFLQKAIAEGSLSLLLECSKYYDISTAATGEERQDAHLLLELLTPIAKTYPSEKGKIAVDNGLQVLGGYGYCSEFVLQQYYRDIRIMSIYEGTTGIQSLDLLGRKVPMKNGKALQLLMDKINQVVKEAETIEGLKPYAAIMTKRLADVQEVLMSLMPFAMKQEYEKYLADANLFMELSGILVIGYQWLRMAVIADKALKNPQRRFDSSFYEDKIHLMKFYFKYEMPKINALKHSLLNQDFLTIVENDAVF